VAVLSYPARIVLVMRDLLFPSSPVDRGRLLESVRAGAKAFVLECRAIDGLVEHAEDGQREFVAGEVAAVMHLSPAAATRRVATALSVMAQPRVIAALETAGIGVPHALALLSEVEHLDPQHADAVLAEVLGEAAVVDDEGLLDSTPGELRSAVKRAILQLDPAMAKKRHEAAKKQAQVQGRPLPDGMGRITIDCTAVEMAKALAAIDARARAMSFETDDLTIGQRRVAAALHALGCERVSFQAVLECPVERAVDLHTAAQAPVWSTDVRMPVAVALGLSDHPAVLAGYGPIDADQARALLPSADLVKACVDARTGEVLAVDRPVRARSWQSGNSDRAAALRSALVQMATSGGTVEDLACDGYVPSEALGRLVDLRDVTSTLPGDATPARRSHRDHRLPYPLGPTAAWNLQNLSEHWHRAKHAGWESLLLRDGSIRWTSPARGVFVRRPKRTGPPAIPPGVTLPPLTDGG
jgi:hypothetical protein